MILKILEALTALAQLPAAVERLVAAIEKHNVLMFLQDSAETRQKINSAESQEEYREASQKLADLIKRS